MLYMWWRIFFGWVVIVTTRNAFDKIESASNNLCTLPVRVIYKTVSTQWKTKERCYSYTPSVNHQLKSETLNYNKWCSPIISFVVHSARRLRKNAHVKMARNFCTSRPLNAMDPIKDRRRGWFQLKGPLNFNQKIVTLRPMIIGDKSVLCRANAGCLG